ncbi:MAG: hypothetical protein GPOALKHO_000474 [Sodalis sp.]|nr:MAG: hypothetical protein GPOALKHO_000474 [Sodalis sp.]
MVLNRWSNYWPSPCADEPRRRPLQTPAKTHRRKKISPKEPRRVLQSQVNDLWRTLPRMERGSDGTAFALPHELQENLLYFMEKMRRYSNSGNGYCVSCAKSVGIAHLYDEGKVSNRFMQEFLNSHPMWSINRPITARITAASIPMHWVCHATYQEYQAHLPIAHGLKIATGSQISPAEIGWKQCISPCTTNFKDESLISQLLSPKIMRDFRLLRYSTTITTTILKPQPSIIEKGIRQYVRNSLPSTI